MSDAPAGPPGGARGGARRALIIANDTYDHASLSQLRAPEADARALADVLGDPEIGDFEVTVVHNEASYEVQARVDDLFADSRPDDLLLLHFSGHGLKSDSGELFFAARNTRPDRLGSTAVAADFVQRCMRSARARTIVLFLDCCYGGAFGEGVAVRAAGPVNVVDSFPAGRLGGGRGRAVLSASSAMEYAFEGTTLTADHEPQPSVFTSAVVEGLRSGEADRDEDGLVALGELYDYVFDRVREQNPRQTPGRDVEMSGEVYLARSRRRRIRPIPVSDALTAALANPDPTYRRGAVLELRDRLGHEDLGVALGALEALQQVARTDTKSVADDAAAAIASAAPSVSPAELDFGELAADADVAVERELTVTGVPLAREVSVEAEPPLSAIVASGTVTVAFSPTGRPYAGTLRVVAPTGAVVVPARARVASHWAGMTAGPAVPDPSIGQQPSAPPGAEPSESTTAGSGPAEGATGVREPATPGLAKRRLTPVPGVDEPVSGDDTQLFDVKPDAAPVPPLGDPDSPTGEQDPPRMERTAPATDPPDGGRSRSLQVEPAEGATTVGGPTRPARRVLPRRRLVYAAAAVLVLAAAGTAAAMLVRDRGHPPGNEITAAAAWRLVISNKIQSGGCTVTVTNTDTGKQDGFENVWGTKSFQMPTPGTFRWQANDPGCLVVQRSGSGNAVLPFSQKAGTGDTDAFAAPKAPGKVAVQVLAFNSYGSCDFELHDAADGRLVDLGTVHQGEGPLRLEPNGRSQVYLADFEGCDVRVSDDS